MKDAYVEYIENKMTKEELLRGYEFIKDCIDYVIKRDGIEFVSSNSAPNNYNDMCRFYEKNNCFLVYNGGDHGFLGEEYNVKFRALHDSMHYAYKLKFSYDDERILSDITSREFSAIAYNEFNCTHWEMALIQLIIDAEIRGQIDYYEKNKKYVADQKQFIIDSLVIKE